MFNHPLDDTEDNFYYTIKVKAPGDGVIVVIIL